MLTICLPIYQTDVRMLVGDLHAQAERLTVPVEILCLDDLSAEPVKRVNREIRSLQLVRYRELAQNLGRSRIRNALAREARFPFLLFLDGDAAVVREDFLERYLACIPGEAVWCGGGEYQRTPPEDPSKRLHWTYGTYREQLPVAIRARHPHEAFKTFNFLVPRSVLVHIPFEEEITGYGHEDTLWGMALARHGVAIHHLDNPVRHDGLETAPVFLAKQRAAVDTLVRLLANYPDFPSRLAHAGHRLEKWRLKALVSALLLRLMPVMERVLLHHTSTLALPVLDLYKLAYLLNKSR